jgi:tRNA-2-methylthio-N6-dimethylallyladenosine synthase
MNISGKKYFISTYGCQMNAHDSERMAGILQSNGFIQADDKSDADLIILNTCCIRESAEKKILGHIGILKHLKVQNKNLKIIVCGCMTQQENAGVRLQKRFPYIDAVLGTHNMHELGAVVKKLFDGEKKLRQIYETDAVLEEGTDVKRNSYPLSYVNVMYGCNNFCSYCIVPYVRGRERSRSPMEIIDEIRRLSDEGYKEVTLLGQNVNSFGAGMDDGLNFAGLLRRIDKDTSIPRVRFMTSHPKDLSDELIETIAQLPSVCAHIHLPVQSGSDRILMLMNRRYTREHYFSLVDKLRKNCPEIAISTDIIVGFPSETDNDFSDTLDLVKTIRFDSAFTFIYSKRSGTAAAQMEGHLSREEKSERICRLIALQNGITQQINDAMVGRTEAVLVEAESARSKAHMSGRTSSAKMVSFEGGNELIGQIANVQIMESKKTTLFGRLIP